MFEKDLLRGKRILITGGGSGLGAAMGRRFAELGAELVICGRRAELLEQTASAIRSEFGAGITTVRCDVRDGGAVEAMMDLAFRDAPLDVLVNNGGHLHRNQSICRSARRTQSLRPRCTARCTARSPANAGSSANTQAWC